MTIEVEIYRSSPRQIPFGFGNASRVGAIQVPKEQTKVWEAGQRVTLNGVEYCVAQRLFPGPKIFTLWIE